jgi:hypothetical protein
MTLLVVYLLSIGIKIVFFVMFSVFLPIQLYL